MLSSVSVRMGGASDAPTLSSTSCSSDGSAGSWTTAPLVPVVGIVNYDACALREDGVSEVLAEIVTTYAGVAVLMTTWPTGTHVLEVRVCAVEMSSPQQTTVHIVLPGVLIPHNLTAFVHAVAQRRLRSACVKAHANAASTLCSERIWSGLRNGPGSPAYDALSVIHVLELVMNNGTCAKFTADVGAPGRAPQASLRSRVARPWPLDDESNFKARGAYVNVKLRPGSKPEYFSVRKLYEAISPEYRRYRTWSSMKGVIAQSFPVDASRHDLEAHQNCCKAILERMMQDGIAHYVRTDATLVPPATCVHVASTSSTPPTQPTPSPHPTPSTPSTPQAFETDSALGADAGSGPTVLDATSLARQANPSSHPIEPEDAATSSSTPSKGAPDCTDNADEVGKDDALASPQLPAGLAQSENGTANDASASNTGASTGASTSENEENDESAETVDITPQPHGGSSGRVVRVHSRVNRVVVLSDGRKFFLLNRSADGWFNASHMRGLFDKACPMKKAIENAVTELGLDHDANVKSVACVCTWISHKVARKLVPEDANVGDSFVEKVEEINEPASDGSTSLTLRKVMDNIRIVPDGEDHAGWGSVFDVIRLVTQHSSNNVAKDAKHIFKKINDSSVTSRGGEVTDFDEDVTKKYKFFLTRDDTPVAPYHVLIQVVWACPGEFAKRFVRQCAKLICRIFAGDETLVDGIRANREALPTKDRENLMNDIPEAGSAALSTESTKILRNVPAPHTDTLALIRNLDTSAEALVPVPGLEGLNMSALPPHRGVYSNIVGMIRVCSWTILRAKAGKGASQAGVPGRVKEHVRAYPTTLVQMVTQHEDPTVKALEDAEKGLLAVLRGWPLSFQVPNTTEQWWIVVPPGLDPARAARQLRDAMEGSVSGFGTMCTTSITWKDQRTESDALLIAREETEGAASTRGREGASSTRGHAPKSEQSKSVSRSSQALFG